MRRMTIALALCTVLGCGNDSGQNGDDDGNTFEPVSPAVYVAKVKNILVGQAPTDAEVAAVVADPNALGGLIDGWMQLPEYTTKMQVFFQLAFQQTQISQADFVAMIPPNDLLNGRGVPMLVQNAEESFARTVLQLQAEGRPLTDAFTTKRVMMTTAMMEFYSFLDTRTVADDGVTINDRFKTGNAGITVTLESTNPTIPKDNGISETAIKGSPFYMTWYESDLPNLKNYPDSSCDGMTSVTFKPDALDLHQMLYGTIPPHKSGTGVNCPQRAGQTIGQLTAGDYSNWKMVTIRPPTGGEAITNFYDLDRLRMSNELVINTPHPGFFSTPAFFANWPTNSSNQHRVTLNQALIVATGTQIDGTDPTVPASTPGLDAEHAVPGTACYGCHQLLDPTRSIFSATYSWFYYPQIDNQLKAIPGRFAFQGVDQPMSTIDDFAMLLASHPLVPQAWAQKLCYYANSAACDPADPAFTQIVGDFKSGGLQWNALVKQLLASPIITNASETKTWDTNHEVLAVARRDHLCAALNNRLGLVDVCGLDVTLGAKRQMPTAIAQIVSGLPSDGYGRGGTIPILPNDPNLFYRAGVENICSLIAPMVVDPAMQTPGAKVWSSSQPDAAIADFVSLIMALPPSDARASAATDALKSHFTQASTMGTPSDALRSAFVVACLSPSFIGIGL